MVVIYASKTEDLPVVSRLGDVLRIHRANMKYIKGVKQFHVNVHDYSAWCLFSTIAENSAITHEGIKEKSEEEKLELDLRNKFKPYKFSGKHYSFDPQERPRLEELRKWTRQYFKEETVIKPEMYMSL